MRGDADEERLREAVAVTRFVALVLGLLALCGPASAADAVKPDYRISLKAFTGDDGLPQSGASTLVQTRDGYLWVGTFGGLARFDGVSFRIFRGRFAVGSPDKEGGHDAGPSSDRVIALHEDDEGRLWIGTQDAGLSVYERGAFRHLPLCGGSCQVNDILQGPDRGIWVASREGVFKLDPTGGRVLWSSGRPRVGHSHLVSDSRGRIHVGGYQDFYVVTEQGLQPIQLPDGDSGIWLLENKGEDLLVGTEQKLYQYDPIHQLWQPLGVDGPAAAARDADGLWWVAQAVGKGVVREDGAGGWVQVPELSNMGINSLAWDNEGNLWAGSVGKGLLRVRKPLFRLFSTSRLGTDRGGRAVTGDGNGGLWFGRACGGMHHWSHDGRLQALSLQEAQVSECISSLLLDRDGMLWIGTTDGVLARVIGDRVEQVAKWSADETLNLWQREDGLFLASVGRSTYEVGIDGEGRIARRHRIEALQGMRINNAVEAAKGGTWFMGDQGVLRLIGDEVVERWSLKEGLSSRFARALYEDVATDTVWVGTYGGGLNRIRKGQVQHYGSGNGLFDDTVSCILADERGRLWLGGNRGVTLLPSPRDAADEIGSVGFAASDGLVPAEINGGTSTPCHRDMRGRLWFSLVEGFGVIDPADVPATGAAPLKPYIEHAATAGRALGIDDSTLMLEPFTHNLEIRYTAVNLSRPQDTRFRFRLSGGDGDWMEAGQNRSVLYPSIPWGKHVFEVQARIVGGRWSPPASLQIVHPQPWYQRPWIWTLAMLLGLLVLVGSTRTERTGPVRDGGPATRHL